MNNEYASFLMKMQEAILSNALPKDPEIQPEVRKRGAELLGEAVTRIVEYLRPQIVLEIGAHEATFSKTIKSLLPKSRVIAIEANPTIYKKYETIVPTSGVEYVFKCIADENRVYKFSVPGTDRAHPTMGSVLTYNQKGVFETYDVNGERLDTFLGNSTKTNAMWIDVEGAIGSVLDGADHSLKNCVMLFAELEARERWEGQILDVDVIKRLSNYGLFPVLRDIQRHKWQHNILFLKPEALSDTKVQTACFNYLKDCLALV